MILATLWWLFFWTAIGLCVGSFLNVVIYRLPRDRTLRSPLWSACPICDARIRWRDNLPILSFLLLRGRCRDCGSPIATRYLVVEASMAIIVLMLLDAFFIASGARSGLSRSIFGLTDQLALDWPILTAHVILFACLLSMSAIDLEHYWVDIRFTNLATLAGFALHVLWTPKHSLQWGRPSDPTALMCLLAVLGLGIVWAVRRLRPDTDRDDELVTTPLGETVMAPVAAGTDADMGERVATLTSSGFPGQEDREALQAQMVYDFEGFPQAPCGLFPTRLLGWLCAVVLAVLFVVLAMPDADAHSVPHTLRALIPITLFFFVVLREGSIVRPSDHMVEEALHEERHGARSMVLGELAMLLPAIALGAVGLLLMLDGGEAAHPIRRFLHSEVHLWSVPMMRNWLPLQGLATAASGYVIAGAIGWSVRIFFTLVFGKEAFGSGDIHLMAATGCVAGWPVAVLGFVLTCLLALLGWLLVLPFKRSRALPLGPWLSLSFLIVVVFLDRMVAWSPLERTISTAHWLVLRYFDVFASELSR